MNEPTERRDHVVRERLPWRTDDITECGRPVEDVVSVITREQLQWRVKQHGQQRTAFTVCMTCWPTSTTHASATWATHPTHLLSREMRRGSDGIVYIDYGRRRWNSDDPPPQPTGPHVDRLSAELHAIAALIEAHRDEFDQRVQAASDAALFAARRAQKKQRG